MSNQNFSISKPTNLLKISQKSIITSHKILLTLYLKNNSISNHHLIKQYFVWSYDWLLGYFEKICWFWNIEILIWTFEFSYFIGLNIWDFFILKQRGFMKWCYCFLIDFEIILWFLLLDYKKILTVMVIYENRM